MFKLYMHYEYIEHILKYEIRNMQRDKNNCHKWLNVLMHEWENIAEWTENPKTLKE